MPDKIFSDPELAQIYDAFDGDRTDLPHYLNIVKKFKAQSVLDVGCGTGCFAELLAAHGFDVTGVDPAKASLDIAKAKPYAPQITYIHGTTGDFPPMQADIAFMTGNVAQVFLSDDDWLATLSHIRAALKDNGYLVFEVRDPAQKAWEKWTKENTYQRLFVETIGNIEGWTELNRVEGDMVSFTHRYSFEEMNKKYTSQSTLKFREKIDIEASLKKAGYDIIDLRDAPDRPNKEFVFIARKCCE